MITVKTEYKKYFNIDGITRNIQKYLPNFNKQRFLDAFLFALEAHKGQFRKDGKTPYIQHPVKTVEILISLHADEDTLITALLHDVPEDTHRSLAEIKLLFGEKIAFLVDGITKLSGINYEHNMPERQIESLKKLLLHTAEDLRVVVIKLADRLHNMQTLENIPEPEKRTRIATETLEIYVPIANLLGIREIKYQLEDLCFKHLFPTEYAQVKKILDLGEKKREESIKKFIEEMYRLSRKEHMHIKIYPRGKNLYSIYKKICALGSSLDNIDDRIGLKIIADNISDCYRVLGLVHNRFLPKTDRFRDHIANPKKNGYRSLHTAVFGIDGILTEVQIRTQEMDLEASYGITAHPFDSAIVHQDEKRSEWLKDVLRIEKSGDDSEEFIENLRSDVFQDRIFVFTPKGDTVDLPKDATVLDFAYNIHTELGNHAYRAEVNNSIKPINYPLKTGDTIKILTSDKVHPKLSWLSFIKTGSAKIKILENVKKTSKLNKIQEGHLILQKEFDIVGLGMCEMISFKKYRSSLKQKLNKDFPTFQELFIAIAEGDIKASEVVESIEENYKYLKYFRRKRTSSFRKKSIRAEIKILAKDRFGLLRDISDVLYKHSIDIRSLKGWANEDKEAFFDSDILVEDLSVLIKIFHELEEIENVKSVYRISKSGLRLFYGAGITTIILWLSHPFLLYELINSNFRQNHYLIANMIISGGLLLLICTAIYLISILKNYFPIIRQRKLLSLIPFIIPLVGIGTLTLEFIYLQMRLNWALILPAIVLLYTYLIISFVSYNKTTKQI